MEDVLAAYEKPYNPAEPVVCVDEKPVSLHADLRPPIPAAPGRIAKRDNEYKRCGTANVFCAVEPKAGRHFTLPTPDRSAPEFAQALDTIVSGYPFAQTIHLWWTISTSMAGSHSPTISERKGAVLSGNASPFITRRSMGAG